MSDDMQQDHHAQRLLASALYSIPDLGYITDARTHTNSLKVASRGGHFHVLKYAGIAALKYFLVRQMRKPKKYQKGVGLWSQSFGLLDSKAVSSDGEVIRHDMVWPDHVLGVR